MGDETPINRGDLTRAADLGCVHAFTKFVTYIGEPSNRTSFLNTGEGDGFGEIPDSLQTALKTMSECELVLLARLQRDLDAAGLYDDYNPRLYYF